MGRFWNPGRMKGSLDQDIIYFMLVLFLKFLLFTKKVRISNVNNVAHFFPTHGFFKFVNKSEVFNNFKIKGEMAK